MATKYEISADQRKNTVQLLLRQTNISRENTDLIAQFDPDLAITSEFLKDKIGKILKVPGVEDPYLETLFDVTQAILIPSNVQSRTFSNEQTADHVSALVKTVNIVETVFNGLTRNDQDAATEQFLGLYGWLMGMRPDVVAHPSFPWNHAVHTAVFREERIMFGRYGERMYILEKAPEHLVREEIARHAETTDTDMISLLKREGSATILDVEAVTSPEFVRIVERAPEGNLKIARSTFEWAIYLQFKRAYETVKKEKPRTSAKLVKTARMLAQKKWQRLADGDRQTFLTSDLLFKVAEVHSYFMPQEFEAMVKHMIRETSRTGEDALITEFTTVVERNPSRKFSSFFTEFVPDVMAQVEARRPKTILQKAAVLFKHTRLA